MNLGSDEFSKDLLLWVCVLRKTKYFTLLLAIYSAKLLLVIYSRSKMFIQTFMDNLGLKLFLVVAGYIDQGSHNC